MRGDACETPNSSSRMEKEALVSMLSRCVEIFRMLLCQALMSLCCQIWTLYSPEWVGLPEGLWVGS